MISLLMPSRIEIVEPFTRVRSFDGDGKSHGIELLLRAINALDNPGLMIVGKIRAELFEFVPGSADHRGRLLEHWEVDLTTPKQQQTHWNSLTQMYELRLGIDPKRIPVADRYVLVVTYVTPMGDRLTDEFTVTSTTRPSTTRSTTMRGR